MTLTQERTYKPKKKRKLTPGQIVFIICMCVWPLCIWILFTIVCSIDGWIAAFQRWSPMKRQYVWVGWDNFELVLNGIFKDTAIDWKNAILNSIYLFLFNNFVMIPIGVFFGYLLYKKMPFASVFRVIFYLPNIISPIVLTMAFKYMLNVSYGPIPKVLSFFGLPLPANGFFADPNWAFPIILIYNLWAGLGYFVVMVTGAMNRIPKEVLEVGMLDGISITREFWQVVVPLIMETIKVLFLSGVSIIFSYFLTPMLLTKGGPYDGISSTIALKQQQYIDSGNINEASAWGIITSIVAFPLTNGVRFLLDKLFPPIQY